MSGKLYLVPTPIGNLGDMTYRAVAVLKTVDKILAEDTRTTKVLLNHYEISTTLSLPEANDIRLMSVYPNPTTNRVVLNVGNYGTTNLSLQFIDINGRILLENKIINIETNLDIENYPVAIYFLKVMDKNSAIKIFKIIKN